MVICEGQGKGKKQMSPKTLNEFLLGEDGVLQLMREEKYQHALNLIMKDGKRFPEAARMINYHLICLAATLGYIPQALQTLEAMLKAGIYYPPVLLGSEADPPGLTPLLGLPEFEQLKAAHYEQYQQAMEKASPILVTVAPTSATALPPLLMAVHGNCSMIEREINFYRPATEWGWTLAMPQSSQPWGIEGQYVWGDWEVTSRQLEKYWGMISRQAEYDSKRIVTAGISKGGEVAVWLAMSDRVPAQGFIAIAPSGSHVEEPQKLRSFVEGSCERGLRGYLIVGDQDTYCYEPTLKLATFLKEQGIPHELEVHSGLGHWFPLDFERSLRRGLEFVLEGAA